MLLVTLLNGGGAPSLEYLWLQDNLFSMSSGGAFYSPVKRWKYLTNRLLAEGVSIHDKRIREHGQNLEKQSEPPPDPEDLFWECDAFELEIDGTAALWAARRKWREAGGGGEHCRMLRDQYLDLCRNHKGLQMLSDIPVRELQLDSSDQLHEREQRFASADKGAKKRWTNLRVTTALTKGRVRDQLTELDLRSRSLGDFELLILADLIEDNGVLLNVDLRGNYSSEDSAVRWSSLMQKNMVLQTVSSMPLRSIMDGKEEKLDLRGRELNDFEVSLLAELLEMGYATGVKSLDLRENDLTVPAARRMLRVLLHPPAELETFEHLNGIPINDFRDCHSLGDAVSALLMRRKSLGDEAAKKPQRKAVELERLDDFGAYVVASLLTHGHSIVKHIALPRPRVSFRGGARAIGGVLLKVLGAPDPPTLQTVQFGGLTLNPPALRSSTGVLDLRRQRLGHLETVVICCALQGLAEAVEFGSEPVQEVLTTPLALSPPPGKAVEASEVLLRSVEELLAHCSSLRQWGPIQIKDCVDANGKVDLSGSLVGDLELLILIQLFRSGRLPGLQRLVIPGGALLSEVAVHATLLMLSESPIENIAEQWGGLPLRALSPGPQSVTLVDLDLRAAGLGDYEAMTLSAILPEGSPSLRQVDLRQNPGLTSIAAGCLGPSWVREYPSLLRLSTLPVRLLISRARQAGGANARSSVAAEDDDSRTPKSFQSSTPKFTPKAFQSNTRRTGHSSFLSTGAPAPDVAYMLPNGKTDSESLIENNVLDASGRQLGNFEASLLALFLKDGALAATIDVSMNPDIHGSAARELAEVLHAVAGPVVEVSGIALVGAASVTEMNRKDCGLGSAEGLLLSTLLKRHMALISCDLRGNVFEPDVAEALADAVVQNGALETFSAIPVRALKKSQIRTLDLSHKQLGDPEIIILSRLLRGCTSLYSLDLNGNPRASQSSLTRVLEVLLHQSSAVARLGCWNLFALRQVVTDQIAELEPAASVIGDFDAGVLAEVLCETTELKHVNLQGTELQPNAKTIASKLVASLRRNTSLRSLNGVPLRALFQRANTEEPFPGSLNGCVNGDPKNDWGDFEAFVLLELLAGGAIPRPLESIQFSPGVLSSEVAAEAAYVLGKSAPEVHNFNGIPIARLCNDPTLTYLRLGRLPRKRTISKEVGSCTSSIVLDNGDGAGEAAEVDISVQEQSSSPLPSPTNQKSEADPQESPADTEREKSGNDLPPPSPISSAKGHEPEGLMASPRAEGSSAEGSEGVADGDVPEEEEESLQSSAIFEFELELLSSLLPAARSLTELELCLSDEEFGSLSDESIQTFRNASLSPSGPPLVVLCGMPADILRSMRIGRSPPLQIDFRGLGLRDFESALLAPLVRRTALLPNGLRRVDLRGHCFGDAAALAFESALAKPVQLEDFCGLPLKAIRAGDGLLTELELSDVGGPLSNFEVYLATSWLLENNSVTELRFPAGLKLDSTSMTAERLRTLLRSNTTALEVVAGIPVGPFGRGELEQLTLSDAVLGDVEGIVLTEILEHTKERVKRLALVADQTDTTDIRIWRMFRSAAVVLSAVMDSGVKGIDVTLWGQLVNPASYMEIHKLMLAQLTGTSPNFENLMNTPLARLCQVPVKALQEDDIDEVSLRDKGLTDFEMIILIDLLRRNRSVRRLDFRQNPSVSDAVALDFAVSVVRRGDSKLIEVCGIPVRVLSHAPSVDLSNLFLGDFEAVLLKEIFPTCKNLKSVELKNNRFTQQGAQVLVQALFASQTIEEFSGIPVRELACNRLTALTMRGRGLGDLEAFIIAELMQGNSTITLLDLSKNNFSSALAAEALGESLMSSSRLATYNNLLDLAALRDGHMSRLKLAERGLGDFDAVLVGTILKSQYCASQGIMEEVDFAKNCLSLSGFLALVGAFKSLPRLKRIDLRPGEPLSQVDVLELLEALTQSLRGRGIAVNLFGWDVGIELLETLLRLLRDELKDEALSVAQVEMVVKALRVSEFGLESLTVRGILLSKSEVLTLLRGVVACVDAEPGRNLVLNAYGYPMSSDDCRAVLAMLEKDASTTVDVFKVGAIVGSQRYKSPAPKVASAAASCKIKPSGIPSKR
eukprot:gnl/MRDRNA2_/MRDRNA2_81848_c0_seq1.p1 gnl/MRDRNA2_/MRDRNA2_81848_c0~~gnl/MRDRNA2_/MRDRNA2_81848_c0_seq1.p1  ORF type:complete len:2215 (+),score=435.37 gnl/MRDRNA2_/MRDRNA2_81848_c0_seq1:363-6647(+)